MKKNVLFLAILSIISFWFTVALTDITDDDLQSIIDEVNQEIEKEITIIDLNEEKEIENKEWVCGIEEPCDDETNIWNELETAITKLHGYWVTKFETPITFMSDKAIRRDEVLKMFFVFAKETKNLPDLDESRACSFSDLSTAHSDIVPMIAVACQHWLFKWSKGKFMPTDSITNAQAVIVLIRMIDWYKDEANVSHYAENYISTAENKWLLKDLWISDKSQRDQKATRATVAKLLYRADK